MNEKIGKYPLFPEQLIIALQQDFPDKLPEKQLSEYEFGFKVGQQSIIKKLQFELDKLLAKEDS